MRNLLGILFLISFTAALAQQSYQNTGIATYYDDKFNGRPTASGEIFNQQKLTAAHRSLPFGTMVKVTNLENNKSVIVKVNDRGPFIDNRLIDLSKSAAQTLGFVTQGLARVRVESISATAAQPTTAATPVTASDNTKVVFPNELYDIDIKYAQAKGFAVQIGSFTELSNLMRMAQEAKRSRGYNLLVQVTDRNQKKLNRLLVGPVATRAEADKMQASLKTYFPGCFVVDLQK